MPSGDKARRKPKGEKGGIAWEVFASKSWYMCWEGGKSCRSCQECRGATKRGDDNQNNQGPGAVDRQEAKAEG
ncbi:uncharacterized protein N7459_001970 [Penicillium hispanicum]|uniref:uncharacterized protein n=1 Tax=Penicillium hispanicum TaxID=1080232 RepID=UPI0025423495|nr:uncharacterized protein N7459_001970 [Penicillium hispanicum]KAJ5591601.1 hypothetical protein N7459_001970 [Penicillium hispanicum]